MFFFSYLRVKQIKLTDWMSHNFLQLKPDRTEILLIGPDNFNTAVDQFIGTFCSNIKPTTV